MTRAYFVGALAIALLILACSDNDPPTGPTTGSITVTVTTTGDDAPTGYTVSLDGSTTRSVDANGSVSFASVSTGSHGVELTDVPANCSVTTANPVSVTVISGGATPVAMNVTCSELVGSIEVTVASAGEDIPASYLVVIDNGIESQPVDANGSVTFTGLAVGTHEVELSELTANCSVTNTNPTTVTVSAGVAAPVVFDVECNGTSLIAFGAQGEIYVIRPDGSGLTLLTPPADGQGGFRPLWSPDGTRIAFFDSRDGFSGLYVMNRDGSSESRLAEIDYCCDFAWSPDGTRIAFSHSSGGAAQIYVVDVDGTNLIQITDNPEADREPSWSPDGNQIVFERFAGEFGGPELYRIDADGTDEIQLTTNPEYDEDPTWSPDGSRIAFMRGYDEGGESWEAVYTMNPDGSDLLNVGGGPGNDEFPVWSPDGTRIAFVGGRQGNRDIYVVNADGSGLIRLTEAPQDDEWPSWSPDGTELVFCRQEAENRLLTISVDGSGEAELLPYADCTPQWSPFLH